MEEIQYEIERASARWQEQVRYDTQLRNHWNELSWMLFAGDQQAADNGISQLRQIDAYDAICTLIHLDQNGVIEFVESVPAYGRDLAGNALLQLAVEAPMGHVLQQLLIVGALDHLLVIGLEHLGIDGIPQWAHQRALSALSAMIRIDSDEYWVGCPDREHGFDDECPHQSLLLNTYEIGVFPVTQAIFQLVSTTDSSMFSGASRPVESISWLEAVQFCNAMSKHSRLELAYDIQGEDVHWNQYANGYRLPTEMEWEAAARAGTEHRFSGGNDLSIVGLQRTDGVKETRGVGLGKPNGWKVYDMSGLVYEWCWDWYAPYPDSMDDNYSGPYDGSRRVRRGGSWMSGVRACEVWCRSDRAPIYKSEGTGFRLARSI